MNTPGGKIGHCGKLRNIEYDRSLNCGRRVSVAPVHLRGEFNLVPLIKQDVMSLLDLNVKTAKSNNGAI